MSACEFIRLDNMVAAPGPVVAAMTYDPEEGEVTFYRPLSGEPVAFAARHVRPGVFVLMLNTVVGQEWAQPFLVGSDHEAKMALVRPEVAWIAVSPGLSDA